MGSLPSTRRAASAQRDLSGPALRKRTGGADGAPQPLHGLAAEDNVAARESNSHRCDIVAIHHHMVSESPRMLFLHHWGRNKAVDLATTLRKALDPAAWEGNTEST